MTESNINEKITETIANILKKTKVFEKLNRIEMYAFSFVTITSIYGFVNLFFNNYHYNRNYNKNITYNEKHANNYENIIKNYNTITLCILKHNESLGERINKLERTLVSLIENQQKKIDGNPNLPTLNSAKHDITKNVEEKIYEEIKNNESLLLESTYTHLIDKDIAIVSDIANGNHIDVYNNKNNVIYEADKEYIDLIDNSYDSLPCLNGNKLTRFNRLFNWE